MNKGGGRTLINLMHRCKFFSLQLAPARKQPFQVVGQVGSSHQPLPPSEPRASDSDASVAMASVAMAAGGGADAQTLIRGSGRCRVVHTLWNLFCFSSLSPFRPASTQNGAPGVSGGPLTGWTPALRAAGLSWPVLLRTGGPPERPPPADGGLQLQASGTWCALGPSV